MAVHCNSFWNQDGSEFDGFDIPSTPVKTYPIGPNEAWLKMSDHSDFHWNISAVKKEGESDDAKLHGPVFESSKDGITIDSTSTGLATTATPREIEGDPPDEIKAINPTMQGLVDELESASAWSPGPAPTVATDYIRMYFYSTIGDVTGDGKIVTDFDETNPVPPITPNIITDSVLVSTIIDEVRRRLQDVADVSFDDTILIAWINEGARVFSVATGCCQAISTNTTNQANFNMLTISSVEFVRAYNVLVNGTPLDYVRRNQMRSSFDGGAGTPKAWTQWGTDIRLDKVLPFDQTLEIWYSFVPDRISLLTDLLTIDRKYINGVVNYVTYRALASDREGGLANRAYQEYVTSASIADADVTARVQRGGFR